MNATHKAGIVFLTLIVGIVIFSIVYEPYSLEQVSNARAKAKACDKEAIAYLGDYLEKIGAENEIRELMQLSQHCRAIDAPVTK